ncbi:hypothetical protein D3C81_1701410 [compost metagenome]
MQFDPQILAYRTAGTITANHIAGLDGFDLARLAGIVALEGRGDRVCVQILSQALIHHQLQQTAVVMRHQVRDRMLHAVEQDVVQTRLIHYAVG